MVSLLQPTHDKLNPGLYIGYTHSPVGLWYLYCRCFERVNEIKTLFTSKAAVDVYDCK